MAKVVRTMQGKEIDMEKLQMANELTPAVGNVKVNARGDELGPGGKIIKTREEIMKDEVLPDALEAVQKFNESWDVHFLTARNFDNAYSITKDWLDLKGFPYKSINVVKKSIDKPDFLKQVGCDLFIDDLSAGQEYGPSYQNLYHTTIKKLQEYEIPHMVFNNNWKEIVERYIRT